MAKESNDGCANVVGGVIVFVIIAITAIPKEIWIVIGVMAGIGVLMAVIGKTVKSVQEHREEARAREKFRRAAQAEAEAKQRQERARKERQQRVNALGTNNADLVESVQHSVKEVAATEAARAGWLGEVDFTADLKGITESFKKAHSLRKVAGQLSALDKPTADDQRVLADANTTADGLERSARERIALIAKCATEARRIDESLRNERKDAKTAEQRAELHGKLSAMLYGIEAAPVASPDCSAASAVLARVQAYREIKNQIQQARKDGLP
ncbi:MAG: hypothetical protein U0R81_13565 [Mycobacterium sp.]